MMIESQYFQQYPIYKFEDIKEKKIIWDHNRVQEIEFRDRLVKNKTFGRAFLEEYDMTNDFYNIMNTKTKGKIEDHFVGEITGLQGIGKSRVTQQIIKKNWGHISMNNIVFRFEDAIQRCRKIQKKSFLIVDEQVLGFGVGSDREMQEIQNIIEVTRIHGLSLFFCSPTTRHHPSIHYNLEVLQRNIEYRLSKVLIKKQNAVLGYIIIRIPQDKNDSFWINQYEPAKKKFVETFLSRQHGRLDLDECSKALMDHPKYSKCKTNIDKQVIATKLYPTMTTQEINLIIANCRLV